MKKLANAVLLLALASTGANAQINVGDKTPEPTLPFTLTEVATFNLPWRIAFLPDGRMLVTEKVGPVWLVTQQGVKTPVANAPAVMAQGQGGMLGIFVSPDYATTHNVYLTYSEPGEPREQGVSSLALARAKLTIGQGTASLDGLQVIWREMPKGRGGQFGAQIAFSPDGATLATAGNGTNVIQLWDTATWQMTKALQGHRLGIKAVRFSPDGQELASSSADQTTRLWHLSTGEQVVLRDDEGVPTALAFSPDGRTLAVGTFEGSVKLWNVTTHQQIASLEAGASVVFSINFSPNGSALSSITLDGKARVWQAPLWAEIQAAEAGEKAENKKP